MSIAEILQLLVDQFPDLPVETIKTIFMSGLSAGSWSVPRNEGLFSTGDFKYNTVYIGIRGDKLADLALDVKDFVPRRPS